MRENLTRLRPEATSCNKKCCLDAHVRSSKPSNKNTYYCLTTGPATLQLRLTSLSAYYNAYVSHHQLC